MMSWDLFVFAGVALAAALVGVGIGRRTSGTRQKIRDLETRAELLAAEREHALGELAVQREEVARLGRQLETYRRRVVDHFSGTWDLMRALSLRYRADFERLAEGEAPPWDAELAVPARRESLPATSGTAGPLAGSPAKTGPSA